MADLIHGIPAGDALLALWKHSNVISYMDADHTMVPDSEMLLRYYQRLKETGNGDIALEYVAGRALRITIRDGRVGTFSSYNTDSIKRGETVLRELGGTDLPSEDDSSEWVNQWHKLKQEFYITYGVCNYHPAGQSMMEKAQKQLKDHLDTMPAGVVNKHSFAVPEIPTMQNMF